MNRTAATVACLLVLSPLIPAVSPAQQAGEASLRIRVLDAETRRPLTGAHVTFPDLYRFWITDADGHASVTGLRPGEHRVEVSMAGFDALEALLQFEAGAAAAAEVTLWRGLTQGVEQALTVVSSSRTGERDASIRVRVTDAMTRQPIVGARVTLEDLHRYWITDPIGAASLSGIPPGEHWIEVTRLGYSPIRGRLIFERGAAAQVDVALTPQAVGIEGVTVAVRSGATAAPATALEGSGFYDRYGTGFGYQLDRRDIESANAVVPSEVFRRIAGVRIVPNDRDEFVLISPRTPALSQGPTVSPGDIRRGEILPGRGCRLSYYLDGVVWQGELDDLSLDEIEAVEVYVGPSQIPPAYSRTDSNCGVALIWTRSGQTPR